jgi:hypothetical protein
VIVTMTYHRFGEGLVAASGRHASDDESEDGSFQTTISKDKTYAAGGRSGRRVQTTRSDDEPSSQTLRIP